MKQSKSVETLISEINTEGFRIHNLFQFDDFWQCNLRAFGDVYYNFAQDSTLVGVLEKALKVAQKSPKKSPPPTGLISAIEEDFSDL